MLRLMLATLTIAIFFNLECSDNPEAVRSEHSQVIGEVTLYTFSPSQKHLLGYSQPFSLPPNTPVREAIDKLGQHLSETYFSKTYANELTDIHFEVIGIDEISTPSRPFRIAVIDMVDKNQDAMGYFFQGSTGGQTTYCLIGATFLQPHLSPPLLDGLILLYNGEILPELDHIDLTGILVPRSFQHVAEKAIRRAQREAAIPNGHTVNAQNFSYLRFFTASPSN
jgi:hypothetical protein